MNFLFGELPDFILVNFHNPQNKQELVGNQQQQYRSYGFALEEKLAMAFNVSFSFFLKYPQIMSVSSSETGDLSGMQTDAPREESIFYVEFHEHWRIMY